MADFYVSPTGNDANPGTVTAPFATIERARDAVRKEIVSGLKSNVLVLLRSGTYELSAPLVFGPQDSGSQDFSITYAAYPGETPVVSAGRRITGWKHEENGLWTVTIPEVAAGKWYFRELYVDNTRAIRARTPNRNAKEPWLRMEAANLSTDYQSWTLQLPKGSVAQWKNLSDVEVVVLGNWDIVRKRLSNADPITGLISLLPPHVKTSPSIQPQAGSRFYLENARSFLDQPGEWYLDRTTGVLSYWPLPNQNMTQAVIFAPQLKSAMTVKGAPGSPVKNLIFKGITIAYTDSTMPVAGWMGDGGCHSHVDSLPGLQGQLVYPENSIEFEYSSHCYFVNCIIGHLGGSAVLLGKGCKNSALIGNVIFDIGGSGIRLAGGETPLEQSVGNQIVNNLIYDCGIIYMSGAGINMWFCADTLVKHNEIHDMPYNGVSLGVYLRRPTMCKNNRLEDNHIYNTMKTLADGGGIYTLGIQPDTIIKANLIHDVSRNQSAIGAPNNGIFFDEGSQGYQVNNNVIYKTSGDPIRFNGCSITNHTFVQNFLGEYVFWKGIVGKYALKTADNHYWDQPHSTSLEPKLLTVSTWIRPLSFLTDKDTKDPSYWLVCKNGDELTDGHYSLLISHQNIGAYLNIGGGRENCYSAWSHDNPIKSNEWTHVAMTYDGRQLAVFCNGKLAGRTMIGQQTVDYRPKTEDSGLQTIDYRPETKDPTTDNASNISSLQSNVSGLQSRIPRSAGTGILRIGKRSDNYGKSFVGLMDDVRIYSRALSAEEIAAVTRDVRPKTEDSTPATYVVRNGLPSSVSSLSSNLVFHLDFTSIHDKIEEIKANAGPQEPYRSRFAKEEKR